MKLYNSKYPNPCSNSTYRNLTFVMVLSMFFISSSTFALDEGTTIIGTKEAPNVLNVVPWQDDEFTGDPWKIQPEPTRSVLENSQKSLDKDVLRREIEYFNLLRNTGSTGP